MKKTLNKDLATTVDNVRQWGIEKGITGPGGKATGASQFGKTVEETMELCEAIMTDDLAEIKDAIGDITVTLILLSDIYGLTFEECLESVYEIISKRTGKMVDGVFVKDK